MIQAAILTHTVFQNFRGFPEKLMHAMNYIAEAAAAAERYRAETTRLWRLALFFLARRARRRRPRHRRRGRCRGERCARQKSCAWPRMLVASRRRACDHLPIRHLSRLDSVVFFFFRVCTVCVIIIVVPLFFLLECSELVVKWNRTDSYTVVPSGSSENVRIACTGDRIAKWQ